MKNHHDYQKVYLGGSDIAMLIVQSFSDDGMQLEELRFGGDGDYNAYIVDADCDITESYTKQITHDGSGWIRIYDDQQATYSNRFESGFRVYTRGTYGCIIQLL